MEKRTKRNIYAGLGTATALAIAGTIIYRKRKAVKENTIQFIGNDTINMDDATESKEEKPKRKYITLGKK